MLLFFKSILKIYIGLFGLFGHFLGKYKKSLCFLRTFFKKVQSNTSNPMATSMYPPASESAVYPFEKLVF